MKTITFGIQKGGTGKTSISISVASQLAIDGKKTIILDADPQGNATGWIIKELSHELADVLFNSCQVDEAIQKTSIENLYIMPTAGLGGDLRLYGETKASNKPYAIKQLLPKLEALGFEYCIIDTSPAFSPLEKACFLASDEVIPVLQLDIFSTDGLKVFTGLIDELKNDMEATKPNILRLVLNARDDRLPQQKKLLELYEKNIELEAFIIPVDQGFKKSQGAGFFIQEYAKTKRETLEAIEALTNAIK
ncbi:MAG: AAA family ATPase [Elusimicrobiaceae bacterium]|nr:AAA family ATPase [Elusimicrobiaceae bacterium]